MKVIRIVRALEKYIQLKSIIAEDRNNLREAVIFDNDDIEAQKWKNKLVLDREKLGKFLDTEV